MGSVYQLYNYIVGQYQWMEIHGFTNVKLADDYSNIFELIPDKSEFPCLGEAQIILNKEWRFLDKSLGIPNTYIGWNVAALHSEGAYGKIYRAFRMVVQQRHDGLFDVIRTPHDVVLKQSDIESADSHIHESLLHILAWNLMKQTALPSSIPRPYECFKRKDGQMFLCMSYVQGTTLSEYLSRVFIDGSSKRANTILFLEVIGTLAYILHYLQTFLCLNHRDAKVNNILINQRETPIEIQLESHRLRSTKEITLIDFGFACLGCSITVIQAGNWFKTTDLCCKAGRDLAQMIFCIHSIFPLNRFLTTDCWSMVTKWMTVSYKDTQINILNGFTPEGVPLSDGMFPEYNTGIYQFLRHIDPLACTPLSVFAECCEHLIKVDT